MPNKAFPNDAPKRTTVFEWHSRFKAGRISIEDDPRQGRPKFQRTDENVQKITDLIKENPRTTLLELEQDTGISKTTIGRIVTEDLKLRKTPTKFIPRFLTNEQKLCRLATCENMLEMTRTDPEWKDKIITGDETWVYGYDPETKRQSAEWRGQGEPRPKKSRILKSRNKVLLVAFLDNKGIVHHEYLPAGQTVIKEMYLGIILREAIRKKRSEKWTNDIAPNDFFLFPKLKAVLKGRHFDTRDDIIEKSPLALKSIPKEAYKNCFDNWEKRWRWIKMEISPGASKTKGNDNPREEKLATNGKKLTTKKRTRGEATRRLLAAIIWQMTVALRRVNAPQSETEFRSTIPRGGRRTQPPPTPGECHQDRTPTTEESSTAMPYTVPETNPRDPGQPKRSQNDLPVPDFTSISRTVVIDSEGGVQIVRLVTQLCFSVWGVFLCFLFLRGSVGLLTSLNQLPLVLLPPPHDVLAPKIRITDENDQTFSYASESQANVELRDGTSLYHGGGGGTSLYCTVVVHHCVVVLWYILVSWYCGTSLYCTVVVHPCTVVVVHPCVVVLWYIIVLYRSGTSLYCGGGSSLYCTVVVHPCVVVL
ncbi:hypothetical protein LAZ67_6000605 [Cordylochernes scorpioides]|uniref:Transposase n=1 Tax=Cordylochernes scorpioides TaxID=51811 RepID=A0ABY6KJF6_9ARAC|nr:hypothetical protein LAZ67_6000605 [Cordylochernes scorpioides]